MRKSQFSEEPIVGIIQEYAAGAKASELCRRHGMSDATFYKWKPGVPNMPAAHAKMALFRHPHPPA